MLKLPIREIPDAAVMPMTALFYSLVLLNAFEFAKSCFISKLHLSYVIQGLHRSGQTAAVPERCHHCENGHRPTPASGGPGVCHALIVIIYGLGSQTRCDWQLAQCE
jgi:hypothetical protein